MKNMALVLVGLLLALGAFGNGCATGNGFADAIKAADTANKEIDAEFSGWNTHMKYHSKPVLRGDSKESVIVTPVTTLETEKVKPQ